PPPAPPGPRLTRSTTPPPRVPPTLERAYADYAAGRLEQAAAQYRRHLATDPNSTDALNGLGAIALQQARPGEAAHWFQRSLSADPSNAVALGGLANVRPADNPVSEESRLRALLAQQPEAPQAAFALGNALARQSRWAEAQQAYFAAFSRDAGNPDYLFNLAVSLDQLQQHALARSYYARALDAAAARPAVFDPAPVRARLQALSEGGR
ncbi:MAG: tetratricopeptide repeat protein, partial [Rhodocyclaceae bacterium]|nr:tetratricopeptide repeat protein [Rhodocyclaceae bacterium]